mgnify:CR=1 FL=1
MNEYIGIDIGGTKISVIRGDAAGNILEKKKFATKTKDETLKEIFEGVMEKVAEQDIAPDTKILRLIETHLDSIKMVVFRNGTLRAGFFRDIWRVEAVRKNFDRTETKLFRQVLTEGKEKGIFDIDNVNIVADIVHYCVKGIEAPYIRGQIGEELDDETGWAYVAKIVYGALGRKEQNKE